MRPYLLLLLCCIAVVCAANETSVTPAHHGFCYQVSGIVGDEIEAGQSVSYALMGHLASGKIQGKQIEITGANNTKQQLLFVRPQPTEENMNWYRENILPNTVAFGYVKGWFNGEEGRPPFHAYARVGDRMFHFLDDGTIHETDYLTTQRQLLAQSFPTTNFETSFNIPPSAREELFRYYRARKEGNATIDGQVRKPKYDVAGFGQFDEAGTPRGKLCDVCLIVRAKALAKGLSES